MIPLSYRLNEKKKKKKLEMNRAKSFNAQNRHRPFVIITIVVLLLGADQN